MTLCTNDLLQQIKYSWLQDATLVHIIHKTQNRTAGEGKYSWQSGQLLRKGKLVVGNDPQLRLELLKYFHSSADGGHSGIDATVRRIATVVYWKGLKRSVRQYVRECEICQINKPNLVAYFGLLQPLAIPDRVWSGVSMDFIEGLPKSFGREVIMVVVDRLSKYAHFVALAHPFTAIVVAQSYLDNIYKLHGPPASIIFDKDKNFLNKFWSKFFKLLGTDLKMSSAYHPQTDGQTKSGE